MKTVLEHLTGDGDELLQLMKSDIKKASSTLCIKASAHLTRAHHHHHHLFLLIAITPTHAPPHLSEINFSFTDFEHDFVLICYVDRVDRNN